ncbi:hypothetical protein [Bradyrhizobium sp.]|jgi:hypothetical protein|uniref:hypothetical protein n=1 Tax=Bradyrhizobium sp. TaxID=376 RepID=UPI003C291F81
MMQCEIHKSSGQNEIAQINQAATAGAISPGKVRLRSKKQDLLQHQSKLARRLGGLQRAGELQHILTFEHCPVCAAGTAHAGKECLRDIAYYNIHTGLLAALIDFRRHYFDDESFLPETLRWKGLEDAAKLVDGP